jgi:hypothetical protein
MGMMDLNDSLLQPRVLSVTPNGGGGSASLYGGGGGLMGGSGQNGDSALAQGLVNQFNKANTDAQARFDKMMGLAKQFGAAQTTQSNNLYRQQLGQGNASLISRGLFNSSAQNAMQTNAQTAAFQRGQQIQGDKANLQMGVLNNVQEQGPDLSMYANLFSAPRTGGSPLIPLGQTTIGSSARKV